MRKGERGVMRRGGMRRISCDVVEGKSISRRRHASLRIEEKHLHETIRTCLLYPSSRENKRSRPVSVSSNAREPRRVLRVELKRCSTKPLQQCF